MAVRERFPTFEDVSTSRPEDLAAEIIIDLQRNPRFFSPSNYPTDLCRLYNREQPTREFASAISEAISWARRELLLVQNMGSTPPSDALMLSRHGLVFTREHINRLRLERLLPDFLLHDRIRRACIDIFNTGRHQAAVFEAFRELEVAIRDAAGYGADQHGRQMIMNAFNEKSDGPLVDKAAIPSEQEAMRVLMAGSVGIFKNPRSHRNVELDDPQESAELLILASHLLRMVESVKQKGNDQT
jgi:uncharacterized protein (TIGR02391 family)